MIRLLSILVMLSAMLSVAYGQDRIWLDNGNPVPGRLTRAMDGKLEWLAADGVPRLYNKKRFLVIFASNGQFMVVSELNDNVTKAQAQIEMLYKAPIRKVAQDIIIKSVPLTVIGGTISYESDEVINYVTATGSPASIHKEEVAAVIYKDGRHSIVRDVVDVAPLLGLAHKEIVKKEQEPLPKAVVKPLVATDKKQSAMKEPEKPILSEADYKEYSEKGILRVHEFNNYLKVIGDKSLRADEKNRAVQQALNLFEPSATVAVSSSRGVKKYPVKEYLNRLKLLPYSKVNITWNEVKYVSALKQEADGNYYGLITGQQVFEGYGADGKTIAYGDVTKKSVRVKMESYQKTIDGNSITNWEVLLGNIGMEQKDDQ